jgi:polar amino acid transport system substrate-binding protein
VRFRPRRFGAILAAALALGLHGPGANAAAVPRPNTACLDSSSPSYAADRQIVASLARFGDPLTPFVFDGGSGVSERFFQYLSHTKCALIMGFPVDLTDPDPPAGLALTKSYLTTAYVLVARAPLRQETLRPGMTIAVGMATSPHFYLAGAFGKVPNYTADTYQSQEQAMQALLSRRADAAMVWEPSLIRYQAAHPQARGLHVSPLKIQHARWHIAALYLQTDRTQARRFESALNRLARSGQLESIVKPYERENG